MTEGAEGCAVSIRRHCDVESICATATWEELAAGGRRVQEVKAHPPKLPLPGIPH